jgi:hypothetical protein
MNPESDPQPPDRDVPPPRSASVRDDALSWLRTPLTMRHLCALGVFLVGGGIPIALMAGGWAWLGLGVMVIIIIAMAMAHERGLARKRHRPRGRALKRTRGRRRSAKPEGKAPRRTRRPVGSGERKEDPRALPPGDARVPPPARQARKREPARGELPRKRKKQDSR